MGSEDRIPVNCTEFDDFEDERYEDMWNLIKSQPRADAFSGLLNGGGQELNKSVLKSSWDLAPSKAFVPVVRSRSSLSSDSLQLCTEGLGCESCDCMTDSACSESSFGNFEDSSSEEEDEDMECEVMEENMERDEKILPPVLQPRSFPPPLPSLCASSASYMRSFKKDGRFLLQSVKMPTKNFLHCFREGGRLKMQLVTVAEDNSVVLPHASTLIKPENEILLEEVDGGGGSDSEETKAYSSEEYPVLEKCSDIPEVQESEDFSEISETVSNPGDKCNGCEIQIRNAVKEFKVPLQPPLEWKFKGNNKSSAAAKSFENHEISDITPSKTSFCTNRACFNYYNSWRTEQNSSDFCHNWQKTETLQNYPLNKFKCVEANNVNLSVNVNESCLHSTVPKFRLNDLRLVRCHAPKSLPGWGKSQCIATNS